MATQRTVGCKSDKAGCVNSRPRQLLGKRSLSRLPRLHNRPPQSHPPHSLKGLRTILGVKTQIKVGREFSVFFLLFFLFFISETLSSISAAGRVRHFWDISHKLWQAISRPAVRSSPGIMPLWIHLSAPVAAIGPLYALTLWTKPAGVKRTFFFFFFCLVRLAQTIFESIPPRLWLWRRQDCKSWQPAPSAPTDLVLSAVQIFFFFLRFFLTVISTFKTTYKYE